MSAQTDRAPPATETLLAYAGRHAGATMLVCGCGPSLNELAAKPDCITIGVNDVGRRFDPDYLVVVNPPSQFPPDRLRAIAGSRARAVFSQYADLALLHAPLVGFRLGAYNGTDFANPAVLHYTQNSPYVALCLAIHMGARRIGLIGVDFTDDHFFGATGRHPLAGRLAQIEREYAALAAACVRGGVDVFTLGSSSRLNAFPRRRLDDFLRDATAARSAAGLCIVSYASTPVAGVPAILARCITARTPHRARCVWPTNDYGNGVVFQGDLEWSTRAREAEAAIAEADLIIAHNGKIDERHRRIIAAKPVVTMAHNYAWNVDTGFVRQGMPGIVVGQYQATLPEFAAWTAVPNPVPLWEPAYSPDAKGDVVTIAYTPSGRHESYPAGHRLYWHGKGYITTMRALDALARRHPIKVIAIHDRQISHAEALAAKRRAHIVIDECVTGSYHRNSLEGLAAGCVVVNGVGLLEGVADVFRHCAGNAPDLPFVQARLETLEAVLSSLVETGPAALEEVGRRNRAWLERHWDFRRQWDVLWWPQVARSLERIPLGSAMQRIARRQPPQPSLRPGTAATDTASASVVVPHGGIARKPLLRACLENLRRCRGIGQTIVVEMDRSPTARDVAEGLVDAYVFVGGSGTFHKARAVNVALPLATRDLILWLDNDLLLPIDFIERAIAELEDRRLDCLVPWTSVRYLSAEDTRSVMDGARAAPSCQPVQRFWSRQGACGGAVLVRQDFLARYGGLCEEFRGWGGEDNAWYHKVRVLGRAAATARTDQHLYHLYHPCSGGYRNEEPGDRNPGYAANLALLNEVRRLTSADRFLARFPPPARASCPWAVARRIDFLDPDGGRPEGVFKAAASALAALYGIAVGTHRDRPADVEVLCDGASASLEPLGLTLRQGNGEGVGAPVERLSLASGYRRADPQLIVQKLIPPLSILLADLAPEVDLPHRPDMPPAPTSAPGAPSDMKLNLGCCDAILDGYVNVDIVPGAGVEVVADLRQPWPWPDGSIDFIRAHDIIEHLPDKIFTMNEMWRVLGPGREAEIIVPTTDGSGAFQDPTHVSFWNRRSFLYYEGGNPYRERFARSYGILASFRTVRERIETTQDGPKLVIVLAAVKP